MVISNLQAQYHSFNIILFRQMGQLKHSRYAHSIALLLLFLVGTTAIHVSPDHADRRARQNPSIDDPSLKTISSATHHTNSSSSTPIKVDSSLPHAQKSSKKDKSLGGSSSSSLTSEPQTISKPSSQPLKQNPAGNVGTTTQEVKKAPEPSTLKADLQFAKTIDIKKRGNLFYGKRKTTGEQFPIELIGDDDTTYFPKKVDQYEADLEQYDVIVVGSGLAGMTASLYIVDNQKKLLMLEKQNHFGGLAAYKRTEGKGFSYDRGASYWTKAYNEEFQIMNHLGISKYFSQFIIPEPIDTYFWNGVLYGGYPHDGLWDYRTLGIEVPARYPNGTSLPYLPSSFGIFKLQLKNEEKLQRIPDQPFEQWKKLDLDLMNANQWIRQMPQKFHERISKPGLFARERRLWARFQEEIQKGILKKDDPMSDVIDFLNLYSRSALGSVNEDISAMGYANFYLSELEPRFTTPFGTGVAIRQMLQNLQSKKNAHLKKESIVVEIINTESGVEVKYIQKGKGRVAKAKLVIYAAALTFAPNIIKDMDTQSPLQAKTMRELKMAHYSVHNAQVTNHPYREAYDTWVRASDYTMKDFTDVILGRWVQLKGYMKNPHDHIREMLWDYSKNPDNSGSIISLYNSLMKIDSSAVNETNQKYGDYFSVERAEYAWNRFEEIFNRAGKLKQEFKLNKIVTNRWPYSIHIPEPGHFTVKSRILGKTFGNIIFGNNNLGTPSFQEALFRGHCAANKALYRLDPKTFVQESWSKCEFKL